MRFLLILVADALLAVREGLDVLSDDSTESPEELRELVAVTRRYVRMSEVLLRYAEVVSGKPGPS
jgi:hypothetical protein